MDMFDNKRFCSFRLILSFAAIVKKVKKKYFFVIYENWNSSKS